MDFKFSKDPENKESKQPASTEKGRQNALLVVLLLLVGGFSYIYFFTGLIKPQPAPKPSEPPAPQVVKKPLPQRDGETAKTPGPAAPADKKEAAAPVKPEAKTPTPAPAPSPAAQVAKAAAPKEEPKKAEPAKPAEKKPLPAPAPAPKSAAAKPDVKPAEKKAATPAEKTVEKGADKKGSAKAAEKKKDVAESKPARPAAKPKPAAEAKGGRWTVLVGTYLIEDAMGTDLVRVRKAGLDAAVQPGPRKKASMNRLFLAEYGDRGAAQSELNKLKQHTADAFVIDLGGKHAVYAGSYLLDARAVSEKERLATAGYHLTLKRVEVSIPAKNLTAGSFSDRNSAEAALKKLKESGLKGTVIQQ